MDLKFDKDYIIPSEINLHAEQNAISFAEKHDLDSSVLYTTLFPCTACARFIVQVVSICLLIVPYLF